MNKHSINKFSKSIIAQIFIQATVITIMAFAAYILMTYLVKDVFLVQGTYESSLIEALGSLILTIAVLVPLNIVSYKKQVKGYIAIVNSLEKVAKGKFNEKIPYSKKDSMAQVYENFNKMTAELESTELLKNDFLNKYSHEFKTPISSINGFANLLLEKDLTKQEQRKFLKIIAEESDRLSQLSTNTILFSKINTQKIIVDKERYNISEQIRQCSIILSQKWMEKNIDFTSELPDVMFNGNKSLMQHLWLNLLSNSIKFTQNNGKITVNVAVEKNFIIATFCDNGIGMEEHTLKNLFAPYFQGSNLIQKEGLGLGMSIAKRIVELCNGTISVKSAVGLGTTFVVILPLAEPIK